MNINSIYFFDLETVPQEPVNQNLFELFEKRFKYLEKDGEGIVDLYDKSAGLYAEWGKIVCISFGAVTKGGSEFKVKAYCDHNEVEILKAIVPILESAVELGGHGIKEFDIPFLFRRFLINGITPPKILCVDGVPPYKQPFVDTMEIWGSTQWKYKVSLDLLTHILGIPSPKEDMSGKDVAAIWYDKSMLPFDKVEKIGKYCNLDVLASYRVLCKLRGIPAVPENQLSLSI